MTSTRMTIGRMMVSGAAVAGLTAAWLAFARHDAAEPAGAFQATVGDTKAQSTAAGQPTANDPVLPSSSPSDASPMLGPRIRRHIANVNKLREMIEAKLELNPTQKEKVGRLFDDFIAEIKKSPPMLPLFPDRPPNKLNPSDMRELEEKIQQAQQAGDSAAAEKLREQINAMKKEPPTPSEDRTSLWIEGIRAELKPDQSEAFQKTVESWVAIAARIPIIGPYQYLIYALRNPEVGLSKEELAALDKVLDDTMWANLSNVQLVADESMAAVVEKAQIAVNEKLTPEQQAKVQANVKVLEDADKEARNSAYPGGNPIGRAGSNVETGGECKEPTDIKNPKGKIKN